MFEITVQEHFDAAHQLRGYGGKCEALHGHRFVVTASLRGETLNKIGLLFDFTELKARLREILARFDHTCLNQVPPFDQMNPSSENLATTIYQELKGKLGPGVSLARVQVAESPDAWATFSPPEG